MGNEKKLGTMVEHVLTMRETKESKQESKRSRLCCLSRQENKSIEGLNLIVFFLFEGLTLSFFVGITTEQKDF